MGSKFQSATPFIRAQEDRPAPVPLFASATAEKILKQVYISIAIICASVPLALGSAWYFHDWAMLNIVPLGLMLSGILLAILILREFFEHIEVRNWLDLLDRKKDGRVFGVPLADEFTDEAATEADQERRVRRAIRVVMEQGVSATRKAIVDDHKMMSQNEWTFWHARMIRAGILDQANKVLAVSAPDANAKWDALIRVNRPPNSIKQINVGVGNKSVIVVWSDLLNSAYIDGGGK